MISLKKLIIDILTDEPQLQSDIIKKLAEYGIDISARHLRENFKEINNDFIYGKSDFVVVSNVKGSYKSKAEEDIRMWISNIRHFSSTVCPLRPQQSRRGCSRRLGTRSCRTPTTRISSEWRSVKMPLPLMSPPRKPPRWS